MPGKIRRLYIVKPKTDCVNQQRIVDEYPFIFQVNGVYYTGAFSPLGEKIDCAHRTFIIYCRYKLASTIPHVHEERDMFDEDVGYVRGLAEFLQLWNG